MNSHTLSRLAAACGALALALPAQSGRHVFDVDQANSSFSYSGSVTYLGISGPIVGNPSTFNVSGATELDVTVNAGALTNGEFVAGSIVNVPNLTAIVPNPLPFLPPLANVSVTGATVEFTSTPFTIGGGGAFSTTITATMLSGTATITALGQTQMVPLAGIGATPTAVTGTVVSTAQGLRVASGINTTFSFNDPMTGANGTLNLNGNVQANDRPFATDVDAVSLAGGGTQTQRLSAGASRANLAYFVVGSASGTSPGTTLNGTPIALNPDSYTSLTISNANSIPFVNTSGTLDGLGIGTAGWSIPPLPIPALAGLTFDHAYVVFDAGGFAIFGSNPVPLTLAP